MAGSLTEQRARAEHNVREAIKMGESPQKIADLQEKARTLNVQEDFATGRRR